MITAQGKVRAVRQICQEVDAEKDCTNRKRALCTGKVVTYIESKTARTICKIVRIEKEGNGYAFYLKAQSYKGKKVWGEKPFKVWGKTLNPDCLQDLKI